MAIHRVKLWHEQEVEALVEAPEDVSDAVLTELVLQQCDSGEVCWEATGGYVEEHEILR